MATAAATTGMHDEFQKIAKEHPQLFINQEQPLQKKNKKCPVCTAPAKQAFRCAGCNTELYCSSECREHDAKTHKRFCKPPWFGKIPAEWPVEAREEQWKTDLVATKDIGPHSHIMLDRPVFVLTTVDYRVMEEQEREAVVGEYVDCFDTTHAHREFAEYAGVAMVWMAQQRAAWISQAQRLKLAWNPRQQNPLEKSHRRSVLPDLVSQQLAKRLGAEGHPTDPLEAWMINWHLMPAMTELVLRSTGATVGYGLFANAWRLSYSCNPNCCAYLAAGKLHVVSMRNIAKGEPITIGYMPMLLLAGPIERRRKLFNLYGVQHCQCKRCLDTDPATMEADEPTVDDPEHPGRKVLAKTLLSEALQAVASMTQWAHVDRAVAAYMESGTVTARGSCLLELTINFTMRRRRTAEATALLQGKLDKLVTDEEEVNAIVKRIQDGSGDYIDTIAREMPAVAADYFLQLCCIWATRHMPYVVAIAMKHRMAKAGGEAEPAVVDPLESTRGMLASILRGALSYMRPEALMLEMNASGISPENWKIQRAYYGMGP